MRLLARLFGKCVVGEDGRKIAQAERLARIIIDSCDGLPAATVMNAIGLVIAHAVEKQSVDQSLDTTMALLRDVASLELAEKLGDPRTPEFGVGF